MREDWGMVRRRAGEKEREEEGLVGGEGMLDDGELGDPCLVAYEGF